MSWEKDMKYNYPTARMIVVLLCFLMADRMRLTNKLELI